MLPSSSHAAAAGRRPIRLESAGLAFGAIALPTLIAFNVPPSATFFNQAAALVGWGAWLAWLTTSIAPQRTGPGPGLLALHAAFGLLLLAALSAPFWAALPIPLALSSAGLIVAAALAAWAAAESVRSHLGLPTFETLCVALLIAALLSAAIGLIQVFAPQLADGDWIARTSLSGRAVGNMRQPNHLSSLLLWGIIAAVWLAEARVLRRAWLTWLTLLLLFVLVLSGSRTGALGTGVLVLWALVDRSLSRRARWMLGLTPLIYALFWVGMSAWAELSHHVFGAETRFSTQGDVSSSRFAIWSNTLALIRAHPWAGVGFGEFNFAWTLTPFPDRPIAFFDHTHNLPLHLAVELGTPLTLVVLSLLGGALLCAFRLARRSAEAGDAPPIQRAALVMVLMIALHSLLEYPLWYSYFLLPTAFAFGLCLAEPIGSSRTGGPAVPHGAAAAGTRPLLVASMLLVLGGMFALYDYMRVVVIFSPPAGAAPLADRIADGRRSVFFSHHADYAAATTVEHPSDAMWAFYGAPHYLLDARLMQAWAVALHESGDTDRARYVAARLKEFRSEQSEAFFAVCDEAPTPGAERPFQCEPPLRTYTYRDFR
jgi:O-antigen ligase